MERYVLSLMGSEYAGKTCLAERLNGKPYNEYSQQTIGLDYSVSSLTVDGKKVEFCMWDTAGSKRFGFLVKSQYNKTHGIIFACDIGSPESINRLRENIEEARLYSDNPIWIFATKCDLLKSDKLQEKIDEIKTNFPDYKVLQTSSVLNEGVYESFSEVVRDLRKTVVIDEKTVNISSDLPKERSRMCCR